MFLFEINACTCLRTISFLLYPTFESNSFSMISLITRPKEKSLRLFMIIKFFQ